jgi:chromate transporter
VTVPFRDAFLLYVKIGCLGFGGPAGQIALMHRLVVEERRWVDEATFLRALNFCMFLPGPEAQQLATYLGWRLHGTRGGLAAGVLFVLPGFVVIMALSALYAGYRESALASALFLGVKAAVIVIVLEALVRIARRALKGVEHWLLAGAAFFALYALGVPFPLVVFAAALYGYAASTAPASTAASTTAPTVSASTARRPWRTLALGLTLWLGPLLALSIALGPGDLYTQLAVFFAKLAVVTFGGAYAVLAYVAQAAVADFGWLSAGEMADGLGLAETTPGPLILVLQFVGFLAAFRAPGALDPYVAGALGATLVVWITFAPSFLWIFLGAPHIERLAARPRLSGALAAVTAAVVGVIANLALWFALHVLFATQASVGAGPVWIEVPVLDSIDPWTLGIALAAAIATFVLKWGLIPTLAISAALGLLQLLV